MDPDSVSPAPSITAEMGSPVPNQAVNEAEAQEGPQEQQGPGEDEKDGQDEDGEEKHGKEKDAQAENAGAEAEDVPQPVPQQARKVKWSERYNEDDADVTIVSSDGVRFKVHSFMLKSSSPTFRSMLDLAIHESQRSPIVLTHDAIEHSKILGMLLDIMYDFKVESFQDPGCIACVIDLADKWEFKTVINIIRQQLLIYILEGEGHTIRLLSIAVKLEDHAAIAHLIQHRGRHSWSNRSIVDEPSDVPRGYSPFRSYDDVKSPQSPATDVIDGGRLFTPGTLSLREYMRLPPSISWAMARAHFRAEQETGKKGDCAAAARHFKALMREISPPEVENNKRKPQGDGNGSKRVKAGE